MASYFIEWNTVIEANDPEEAAELAAAILFDQAQEHLTLKVNQQKIELINGVAHPEKILNQSNNNGKRQIQLPGEKF